MIADKIKKRIIRKGRSAIFVPKDFLDIGSRASVDQVLSRLAAKGFIRRLMRGIYDYPKKSARFGCWGPAEEKVAETIARKGNHLLQVCPATAANMTHVTPDVPARVSYVTDGPTRIRTIRGQLPIYFKHASAKSFVGAGEKTGLVFQALRYFGKDRINDEVIGRLAWLLDDKDCNRLLNQSTQVETWMHPIVQKIVAQA